MCYYSYGKEGEAVHTADNDIRCFKIVHKLRTEAQTTEYVSFYRWKTYKPGETYTSEIGIVKGPTYKSDICNGGPGWPARFWHINEGLHAYSDQCAYSVRPRQTENVTDITVTRKGGGQYSMILVDEMILVEATYGVEAAVLWCRIPKGARYYENQYGEIVADTLYIVGEEEPESETDK